MVCEAFLKIKKIHSLNIFTTYKLLTNTTEVVVMVPKSGAAP